jgi:hypothetical protein
MAPSGPIFFTSTIRNYHMRNSPNAEGKEIGPTGAMEGKEREKKKEKRQDSVCALWQSYSWLSFSHSEASFLQCLTCCLMALRCSLQLSERHAAVVLARPVGPGVSLVILLHEEVCALHQFLLQSFESCVMHCAAYMHGTCWQQLRAHSSVPIQGWV